MIITVFLTMNAVSIKGTFCQNVTVTKMQSQSYLFNDSVFEQL